MPVYKESALTRYDKLREEMEGQTFKQFLEKLYDNTMTRSWQVEEIRKRAEMALALLQLENERFVGTYYDKDPKGEETSRGQKVVMLEGDIDEFKTVQLENEKLKKDNEDLKADLKIAKNQIKKLEKK